MPFQIFDHVIVHSDCWSSTSTIVLIKKIAFNHLTNPSFCILLFLELACSSRLRFYFYLLTATFYIFLLLPIKVIAQWSWELSNLLEWLKIVGAIILNKCLRSLLAISKNFQQNFPLCAARVCTRHHGSGLPPFKFNHHCGVSKFSE